MRAEQPADDRAVPGDLLGRIDPNRVECSGFIPLVERILSLPTAASHQVVGAQWY